MENKKMDMDTIKEILDNITEGSVEQNMEYIGKILLKGDDNFINSIATLCNIIDHDFGDNNGVLDGNDIKIIYNKINNNPVYAVSLCYVLSYNVRKIIHEAKQVKLDKDQLIDAIFCGVLYVLLTGVLKQKSSSKNYISEHKDEIAIVLGYVHTVYVSLVKSKEFEEHVLGNIKKASNKVKTCCINCFTSNPSASEKVLNRHLEAIKQ